MKKDGALQNKNEKGLNEAIHTYTQNKDYWWLHEKCSNSLSKTCKLKQCNIIFNKLAKNKQTVISRIVKDITKSESLGTTDDSIN